MATGDAPIEVQERLKLWNFKAGTAQDATAEAPLSHGLYYSFILDSRTASTSSGTGTWSTGLGGFRQVDIYVRFSTFTGTISLVDVYVDSRIDGTNSVNVAHFTQFTSATGATADAVARLISDVGTPVEAGALRADAGAGTIRNIGWGNDLRIRRDISGGTTAPIFSYVITAIARS